MTRRVIVVDDNINNRILESDLLQVAGFVVFETETAQQGIELALREHPDIIVMDVRLPDMRGTEAAKILRQNEGLHDVPIIFVTASVMSADKREMVGISNIGFIGKPINTRTFALQIERYLEFGHLHEKTQKQEESQ